VNGTSYRPINTKSRAAAAARDLSLTQYHKATTGWGSTKALNVRTIIAKFVAAAARAVGLSGKKGPDGKKAQGQWGVEEFAKATTAYYDPIKKHVLAELIRASGKHPSTELREGEKHSEMSRVEKKLLETPQFKALALMALTGCTFSIGKLRLAVHGTPQQYRGISGRVADAAANPSDVAVEAIDALAQLGFFTADELVAFADGGARPPRGVAAGHPAAAPLALAAPPAVGQLAIDDAFDDDEGGEEVAQLVEPSAGGFVPNVVHDVL
jgi:hypothetical protein